MPHRALTVTSTTNFHALGNYFGLAFLGAAYFASSESAQRMKSIDDMFGNRLGPLIMGLMMMAGIAGLVVAITAKKRKDPSTSLYLEGIITLVISILLIAVFLAVIVKYGYIAAMITLVLLSSWFIGNIGRAVQALWELRKLNRVRKMPVETVEGPAEPERGEPWASCETPSSS